MIDRDVDSGEGGTEACDDCDGFYQPGTVEDVIALDTEHEARARADGGDVSVDITGHDSPQVPDSLFDDGPDDPEPEDGGEADEEVEPVELLVQLAKEGEIDPWDIDIVEVTDKFLDALDDADLRTSGRALFYASVLLRMKSDVLLEEDQPEPEQGDEQTDWDPWADAPDDGEGLPPSYDPVNALEAEMDRRLERKTARGKPETLDELVRDLRDAERGSWWKESRTYDTSDSPRGFSRGVQELDYRSGDDFRMDDEPTQDDALGTAHDEDMEATIDEVHAVILEHYRDGRAEILFEEIADAGPSRVETFLALLFLAHRGAIRLLQEELFGDLWIQDPGAIEKAAAALGEN